jgi:hypothetical protein
MKRGRFEPVVNTRHELIRSPKPGLRNSLFCEPNLT